MKTAPPTYVWLLSVLVSPIHLFSTPAAAENDDASTQPGFRIPVTTQRFENIVFFPVRDAPATAISLNDTRVSSEIRGILKQIKVKVGNNVKKGDLIASIDCQDYHFALAEAEAAARSGQAERKFNRSQLTKARKLKEQQSISAEELDRRVSNTTASAAEAERLEALVDKAKRLVSKCQIYAPFEAVVIERLANLGDYLVEGNPIFRLLDTENIEVSAKVQEQDLETLQNPKDLKFVAKREYPLRLRAILPLVESRTRSYEVRLEFTGTPAPPGSAGRIVWKVPQTHLPADLLVRRDRLGIFLEKGGHAQFIPLQEAKEGQPAAVELPNNAMIIIEGRFGLKSGDAVEVQEP